LRGENRRRYLVAGRAMTWRIGFRHNTSLRRISRKQPVSSAAVAADGSYNTEPQ
jgi:hypothetical protein